MVYILTAIISLISVQTFCTSEPQAKFEGILGGVKKKYSKAIVDEVRTVMALAHLHMKPKLAACETLECVESLLEGNRKEAIDNVLADVSHEKALQYKAECDGFVQRRRDLLRTPSQAIAEHDEATLGKDLVNHTKKILKEHDIDPSRIDIMGKAPHELGSKDIARAGNFKVYKNECYQFKVAIQYNLGKLDLVNDYIIRHEVTHLDRSHPLMAACLMVQKPWESSSLAGLRLSRADELEATIRPFMIHENSDLELSQLLKSDIASCVNDHRDGIFASTIGVSRSTATHPDCSEWLPYALKVKQLRDKGVAPLKIKKV